MASGTPPASGTGAGNPTPAGKPNINSQFVKTYEQGALVTDPSGEIKNQQLNEALAAGTVESILMKTGYVPQHAYHVVVKQNIDGFLRISDVDDILRKASFDFGFWQDWNTGDKTMQLKHSKTYGSTESAFANTSKLQKNGEVIVDNYNAGVWSRAYHARAAGGGAWQSIAPKIVKIDAGTVNGYHVDMDVRKGDVLTKQEIIDMINGMFKYNAVDGSLTITML